MIINLNIFFTLIKAEFFLYPQVIKVCHFMRSLRINGFKIDVPYNAVYSRYTICKSLIGYFALGPQEKFYRIFTAMMNKVAYDFFSSQSFFSSFSLWEAA